MLTIILFLIFGIILGVLLKEKKGIIQISEKLTNFSIYLFLFLFGLSVGSNKTIINNFATLGKEALILAIGGVLGSIFISLFVYQYFFEDKNAK